MSKTNALFFCFLIVISVSFCGFDYIHGASESLNLDYPIPHMHPIQEWEIVDFDPPASKSDIDYLKKIINEMQREIGVLKSRLSVLENSEKI